MVKSEPPFEESPFTGLLLFLTLCGVVLLGIVLLLAVSNNRVYVQNKPDQPQPYHLGGPLPPMEVLKASKCKIGKWLALGTPENRRWILWRSPLVSFGFYEGNTGVTEIFPADTPESVLLAEWHTSRPWPTPKLVVQND